MMFKKAFLNFLCLMLLTSNIFFGCKESSPPITKPNAFDKVSKTGVITSYHGNGEIASVTKYINGKKHGLNRSYYENGNLKAMVNYEMGIKQGEAKRYYETGELYRISQYYEDELDGIRTKFRKNGKIMAKIPYQYGWPGVGLKEFTSKSVLKKKYPKLKVEKQYYPNGKRLRTITVFFDGIDKNVEFFIGELINQQFLHRRLIKVDAKNGVGILRIPDLPRNDQNTINVIAKLRTKLRNPYIIQTSVTIP